MKIQKLGLIDYHQALALQQRAFDSLSLGQGPETIFVLEHPHVFTVGRRVRTDRASAPTKGVNPTPDTEQDFVPTVRIARGGDITYHGPGQLVAYPILDLTRRGRDVHCYLRQLEECLILTARDFGIEAVRREGLTGIWTSRGKLASIGISVRKWITMHGLALNVSTDLSYFDRIDPCGIPGCPITSMSRLVNREVRIEEVAPVLGGHLSHTLRPAVARTAAPEGKRTGMSGDRKRQEEPGGV